MPTQTTSGHPRSEAWLRGWGDCNKGVGKHKNPHSPAMEDHYQWINGWEHRYYNDPSEAI